MDCYSAIKRNDVVIHDTTWTNLENIVCERSQAQEAIYYCMIPFIGNDRIGKSIETESKLVVAETGARKE